MQRIQGAALQPIYHTTVSQVLHSQWRFLFYPTSGGPCGLLHRSWGIVPTQTRLIWSRAAPEHGSTATSVGWSRPARPSQTLQTSTSSHSCISALSASRGWGTSDTADTYCSYLYSAMLWMKPLNECRRVIFCDSLLSGLWHYIVPPGSWWVLHQCSGPLSDPSCLVWPCLSSHHTTVCTADSAVVPSSLCCFFIISMCLFNRLIQLFRSFKLTPPSSSLLLFHSGAQWY